MTCQQISSSISSYFLMLETKKGTSNYSLISWWFCYSRVGMGIYDAMKLCKADVFTICLGLAASMGAFLLAYQFYAPLGGNGNRLVNAVIDDGKPGLVAPIGDVTPPWRLRAAKRPRRTCSWKKIFYKIDTEAVKGVMREAQNRKRKHLPCMRLK